MKIPPGNLIAGLVALALFIATPDLALAKGSGGKNGKKNAPAPVATHTTIFMITATSITVTEPNDRRTLAITRFTQFTYKGQLVRWEALQPGMRVAIGLGTNPNVAERVDADDPPTEAKKSK